MTPLLTPAQVRSVEGVARFARERENIRLRRERGEPAPWTADPVLARYRFTNVRRRDDRVSRWIIRHLIEPAVARDDQHLWFTLLVARLINWPPTLERLLRAGVLPCAPEQFDAAAFVREVEAYKAAGHKAYSGAYMLYPTKMGPGECKSQLVARYIIGDVVRRAPELNVWPAGEGRSVERVVRALGQCFGVSSFMAGQVAADLTYTGAEFDDLYTWAPVGPGSARGLNLMYGRPPGATWAQESFNARLQHVAEALTALAGLTGLTLHDVQNVMCEYSKYGRALLGEGRPKVLYKPETEF